MSGKLKLAAVFALCAWPSVAAELPIHGAFGNLKNCVLWENGSAPSPLAGSVLLTKEAITGMEWACHFDSVTPAGVSSWQAAGKCAGEGEEWSGTITVRQSTNKKSVTVAVPRVEGGAMTLPHCETTPYREQLQLELRRVAR